MDKAVFAILLIPVCLACLNQSQKNSRNELSLVDSTSTITVLLHVNGMSCEGCESTISKVVGEIAGVVDVSASHTDSLARVVFDTSEANIVLISEKINELGYVVVGEIPQN